MARRADDGPPAGEVEEEEAQNIALEYGKWLMSSCTAPVGVEALCRLGKISTGLQLLFVFVYMCVETSGAAGGTSGVAGTAHVMLFFLYALLFTWAMVLSRAAASGSLSTSSSALAYFLLHLLVLGAGMSAAFSNFGGEACDVGAKLEASAAQALAPEGAVPLNEKVPQSWSLGTVPTSIGSVRSVEGSLRAVFVEESRYQIGGLDGENQSHVCVNTPNVHAG